MYRLSPTLIKPFKDRELIFVAFVALLCLALFKMPTGFEDARATYQTGQGVVLDVNNSAVVDYGVITDGEQRLTVRVTEGHFAGEEHPSVNMLTGKRELDKLFEVGDRVHLNVYVDPTDGHIVSIRATDYYRLDLQIFLFISFALVLICLGGKTGLKALLSFIFTGLLLWKVLIPGYLRGVDPIQLSLAVVTALNLVIIFLIAGFGKKGRVAFFGAQAGILTCCFLAMMLDGPFKLNGAVRPFAETLLYSGFGELNLEDLFLAGIFVACAGAVMDLAVDVAAGQEELMLANPSLSRWELFKASMRIGRAVLGTMTTTLLLAYSTSLTLMLMTFMSKGVPLNTIFNMNYVSAEVMHTVIGSFGLVLVMPLTAAIGSWAFGNCGAGTFSPEDKKDGNTINFSASA